MSRRAGLLLFVCAAFACGGACANEQEDLEKLRKRISALQQQLEQSSESRSEAADALRDSERAISASNRKLALLANKQRNATSDLNRLQQQSAQVRQDMQGLRTRLSALLYQQYIGGQQEYLPLLLGNGEPNQAARDLQYYGYIARAQAGWLSSLRGNLARLDELSSQARDKSAELAALQEEALLQKKSLEQERHARQQVLGRILAQIRLQNREIGRLHHNETQLSQLVEKLGEMISQANASPFESLRGRLILPVKGKVTNQFGTRRADTKTPWKGWFVRTQPGQEVRAVAAGQVVFADWLRGFGNLLIIDHGKGYMSLYGNNESLYKQVGDKLRGGDTIASTGNSGGNENSGLYFELRHAGEPLDPAKWIAKR